MTDDRLYNEIISRLEKPIDYNLFERFAVDFLCHKGYDAALNPGGGDDGMDIEISDGEGEPYPVTVTTSPEVSGNMAESLTQYRDKGRPRCKCIVVTSVALKARRRKYLYKKASELGFTLVQVYAQNEIASYLERNTQWRKTLLGLSGNPTALSIRPRQSTHSQTAISLGVKKQQNGYTTHRGIGFLLANPVLARLHCCIS